MMQDIVIVVKNGMVTDVYHSHEMGDVSLSILDLDTAGASAELILQQFEGTLKRLRHTSV